MSRMEEVAREFFEACETGGGWAACARYCRPDATFSAQAGPLAGIETLEAYTEWMKGLLEILPDGNYELKAFGADAGRDAVSAYGVFRGTHTGEGGPVPPTGREVESDYVYVMEFDGDRIGHMTKIWNAPHALEQLGWA